MGLLEESKLAIPAVGRRAGGLLVGAAPLSSIVPQTEARPALLFVAAATTYVLLAAPFDAAGAMSRQWLVGILTWLFVSAALYRAQPQERVQVITMIGVATLYECLGSLVLKLYEYRLANLPLYVPPGHGLFYLVALRLASLSFLRQHTAPAVGAVLVGSGIWALRGAFFAPSPDTLGLLCWFLLVGFLARGRDPLFFAVSFVATMALECYGTFLGNWRWAETVPVLGIGAANPPTAIGAGYCVIDATAQLCQPYFARLLAHIAGLRPQAPLHIKRKVAK